MDAKVMKEMLEGTALQVTTVEIGELGQGISKVIPLNAPVKMIVVSGSLHSSLTNYDAQTFVQTGYFHLQNASRMYVEITKHDITLNCLANFYGIQVLLFY